MRKRLLPFAGACFVLFMIFTMVSATTPGAVASPVDSSWQSGGRAQYDQFQLTCDRLWWRARILKPDGSLREEIVDVSQVIEHVYLNDPVIAQHVFDGGCIGQMPADGYLTVLILSEAYRPVSGVTISFDHGPIGTTDANGRYTLELPLGNHGFTATKDGYKPTTITFPLERYMLSENRKEVTIFWLLFPAPLGAEPTVPDSAPSDGRVAVTNLSCESATTVGFGGAVTDDCMPGSGTFTFYLIGDGTDAYQQLTVYEDGFGLIDLPAGDYVVVDEGSQAEATISVVKGETLSLVVTRPVWNQDSHPDNDGEVIGDPEAENQDADDGEGVTTPAVEVDGNSSAEPVANLQSQPASPAVTRLPSTGSGTEAGGPVWMFMAAAAFVSGTGFHLTRRQPTSQA